MGALEGSGRNGVQLVVAKCKISDQEAAANAVRELVKGGINGIVLTAPISESSDLIAELKSQRISIVGVGTNAFRGELTCVNIDDYRAGYDMTKYLIGLGHRRIGFIKGHPSHSSSTQRFAGFEAAMSDAGIKVEKLRVAQGYYSYRSGMVAAEELLSARVPPTAIFAGNDDMASGVLAVSHRKSLDVPRDLSVVGFDDTIAASLWPSLTTVRQPINDIGATAIDVIVQSLGELRAGREPEYRNHVVPHLLVERESSAPPRQKDGA
jgi:LacI family transcriptional regulator